MNLQHMLNFDFRGHWNEEYAQKLTKYSEEQIQADFNKYKERQGEVSEESLVYMMCTDKLATIQAEIRRRSQ